MGQKEIVSGSEGDSQWLNTECICLNVYASITIAITTTTGFNLRRLAGGSGLTKIGIFTPHYAPRTCVSYASMPTQDCLWLCHHC